MRPGLVACVLLLTGCGTLTFARPGRFPGDATFVHHGLDLGRVCIGDDWFEHAYVEQQPLVMWSSAVADEAMESLHGKKAEIDLRVSVARNLASTDFTVEERCAPSLDPRQEVAPYVVFGSGGFGILTVIENVDARGVVSGHTTVFERGTGEVVLVSNATARGHGPTARLRYFDAFTKIARSGTRFVAARLE